MDEKAIFKACKDEGCCDACCLRYLGLKHPRVYENVKESASKYDAEPRENEPEPSNGSSASHTNGTNGVSETDEPESKRARRGVCAGCLGLLQPNTWEDSCTMAKEALDKKGYDCTTFACALSAPIATLLKEKYMLLTLKEKFPTYEMGSMTSLKEAWKWSFGARLAARLRRALHSGAVCPLLVTLHYEYPDEAQELDILKTISPSSFTPHKRPAVDVTRRATELALESATLQQLKALQNPSSSARCVAVASARAPLYIGGRYIKLSRSLPQTPWLVRGERMMESSVQEIIFKPIADVYELSPEQTEHRLKFIAAGREDVDVRCLGDGRPFAVEISDPRRSLTSEELQRVCREISQSGRVLVKSAVHVTKEDLTELKKGEESKSKEYEALCIKLAHGNLEKESKSPNDPITVSDADIARVNSYRNTEPAHAHRVRLAQKTPIRVLHRRPLLDRERAILDLRAEKVEGHPQLFIVRVRTTAGTYVKEWAHGELGRSRPSLQDALGAPCDILALHVSRVLLPWPPLG